MFTPTPEMLPLFATFAPLLSPPVFRHMFLLLCGAILTPGARTVTAGLRVLGLTEGNFSKYHHVFSRAAWSPRRASQRLLTLLLARFVPAGEPVVLVADEHLERRAGGHVAYRGLFRDPVKSSLHRVVYAWGVRWLVVAVLARVPWSTRPWALPFFVFPLLPEQLCTRLGKRHHSVVAWLAFWIVRFRAWLPGRDLVLVGDGTYAALALVVTCQRLRTAVRLVSRLRLDAALYDPVPPQPAGKRGRKPQKGPAQPKLAARLADPQTAWRRVQVAWYGADPQTLEIATGTALWYRWPHPPAPLRWVLVRSPAGAETPITPGACFCTDPDVTAEQILAWYVSRWNIEVTFAEMRTHLGLETQRHWCPRSVQRQVPCLFGVFSLVSLWAQHLFPTHVPIRTSAWYAKPEATFADVLAAVRRQLWETGRAQPPGNSARSGPEPDRAEIPLLLWQHLTDILCYAA